MTTTPINTMDTSASTLADLVLLERYRLNQDQEAFAELVRRYGDMVYAACYRVLGQRELAQDAAQETFYRLLLHSIKINRSLAGWLHQVAVKHALDIRRSNQARQKREIHYSVIRDSDDTASSWRELSVHVDEALNRLPRSTRQLLIRHYLLGIKQDALAREMQVSPATVNRRIQNGLKWLRQSLRANGVKVGLATLGMLLTQEALEAAPASLVMEVGKMNLLYAAMPGAPNSGLENAGAFRSFVWSNLAGIMAILFIILATVLAIVLFIVLSIKSNADHPVSQNTRTSTRVSVLFLAGS